MIRWRAAPFRFIVALMFIMAVDGGCAFGDRNIALTYEPVVSNIGPAKGTIAVADFHDVRSNREIVGEIRNGLGFKTADVLAKDQSAGSWVATAIAQELMKAGYTVEKVNDAASSSGDVLISGSVSEAFFTMSMSLKGTVRASIQVARHHVPVLNREYVGSASKVNWAATIASQEAVLREGLQDLIKQAVPDIVETIEQ